MKNLRTAVVVMSLGLAALLSGCAGMSPCSFTERT